MITTRPTEPAIRRRLLARASALAIRAALRPRGLAAGLLAAGLIGAHAPALAQEVIDLATDAELVIQGAALYDSAGHSVSGAGDLNGDGFDDVIVGARAAGSSYLVFGTDQGLPATIDLATDADVVIQGVNSAGHSVSGAGDLNGDGFDDVIIGAPFADQNGRDAAGASYVIFGTDQGLPAIIDLATDPDVLIHGAAARDWSGWSVSGAGDINDDGIDDLIIGARNAGASYLVFGSDQGLPAAIDLTADADVVIQGAGYSVSGAGDVNGDGIDDLIIGAPRGGPGGVSYVILGSDQGLPADIDLATDADVVIQGDNAYDMSGGSVSGAGDVNGDGIDDLIIGNHGTEYSDRGKSYVIFGSDQGLPALIDLATDADVIFRGIASSDEDVDASVSGAGDVNGDGIDDVIIGAPWTNVNGREYAGTGYVVFGDPDLPAVIDLVDGADLIVQGVDEYDLAGRSTSGAGDLDGDGIDDVIIGAPAKYGPGAAYVVFGGPAAAVERLIARVEGAGLPRGLANSLIKKLESALGFLARSNTNGAARQIEAFIDQVDAQRGKQIDEADADAWLAAAETILDMLSTS